MKLLTLLLSFVFCLPLVYAAEPSAEPSSSIQLAKDLAEALGLQSRFSTQQIQLAAAMDQQFSQIQQQFSKDFTDAPDELLKGLEKVSQEYADSVKSAWSPEEAANIYTSTLVELLDVKLLRIALDHYQSTEGKSLLAAINQASARLDAYIVSKSQIASEKGLKIYLTKVKQLLDKINSQRENTLKNK